MAEKRTKGWNGKTATPLRTLKRNLSVLTRFGPTNTDKPKELLVRIVR